MTSPRLPYKYIVAAVYIVALFMDLLDSTIVNVALPTLGNQFHATTTVLEWTVTGYLLSLAVFIPVSGWAGDRFGTKRTFLLALAVFTGGSMLCAGAWSIESLIAFRVLQGAGGGMLTPVGAAMLYRVFPPAERARASSLLTVPAVLGPACGPIVGGYLLAYHSWRWVFFLNVPFGLLGFVISILFLVEQRQEHAGPFDLPGFVLAAASLTTILDALAQAGDSGLTSVRVLLTAMAGIALLGLFVIAELRATRPMIDLRLFRDRLFATGNAVQLFGFGGQFGTLFLLPLLLQAERGLTPLQSGLLTFPQAIGVLLTAPLAGRVYRRSGPRRMAIAGLLVSGVSTLAFAGVGLHTDGWWIRGLMLVRGGGFAFSLIALQTTTFATVPPESMGRASSIYSVTRQAGVSLTVAILATALSAGLAAHAAQLGDPATRAGAMLAFHIAFAVAALITLLAAAGALMINDRLAAGTMQRQPAAVESVELRPVEIEAA